MKIAINKALKRNFDEFLGKKRGNPVEKGGSGGGT